MYVIFRYYDVMRLQIYGSTALVEGTSALLAVLLGKDSFLRVLLSFARVPVSYTHLTLPTILLV